MALEKGLGFLDRDMYLIKINEPTQLADRVGSRIIRDLTEGAGRSALNLSLYSLKLGIRVKLNLENRTLL